MKTIWCQLLPAVWKICTQLCLLLSWCGISSSVFRRCRHEPPPNLFISFSSLVAAQQVSWSEYFTARLHRDMHSLPSSLPIYIYIYISTDKCQVTSAGPIGVVLIDSPSIEKEPSPFISFSQISRGRIWPKGKYKSGRMTGGKQHYPPTN